MKKLFNIVLLAFVLLVIFSFPKVSALTFIDGTSYFDYKPINSNNWIRHKYVAPQCNSSSCTFNAAWSGYDFTTAYYAFEANVKNEWVEQSFEKMSFDYDIRVNVSQANLVPDWVYDSSSMKFGISLGGYLASTNSCTLSYQNFNRDDTPWTFDLVGHCTVQLDENYRSFNNILLSWSSKDFSNTPSNNPLLVYNPNRPISILFTSASKLYNFKFYNGNNVDLGEVESKLDDVNSNLNDVKNKIDATNTKLDQTNTNLENINNSLTDNDVSDAKDSAGDFFSTFQTETYGLTGIITAPLNLIKSITSSTCSGLPLKLPFINDKTRSNDFVLPCMTAIYEEHFGDLLDIYQTITTGFIAYWIMVRILNLVKDFKNPDHDEIEVLDL